MHPILSDRKKLFIYLAVWAILGVLSGLILTVLSAAGAWMLVLFTLPMMLVYGEVNLSAWYLCRAFPLDRTPLWKIFGVAAISVIIVSSVWTLLCWGWMTAIESFFSVSLSPYPVEQRLAAILGAGQQLFVISLALGYLIMAFERSKEAERNAFEARLLAQQSELKALRMQIDPHFLFNSLNSISALTSNNTELARTMMMTLADFFRKSLLFGSKDTISLKEELSLLTHYLDIEKIRFGSRLNVVQEIDPGALSASVPPLIIQPLVENAIKHGIAERLEGGTIRISAQTKNGRLFVSVENPVDRDTGAAKGTGMGLEIVRRRIHAMFGTEGDLQTFATADQFQVILFIPETTGKK